MRQTPMAMTARQISPKRPDAVASKKETSHDRSDGPARRASKRRSHIGGTTARKRRKTNVIEIDDDVDVEDVDNDALPAKLGKCSKGTDALTASPAFD